MAEIRTMAACCCLCRDRVVDAKRKRLHGAGYTTAKAVLREAVHATRSISRDIDTIPYVRYSILVNRKFYELWKEI